MGGGGSKIEENNVKGHRKSKSDLLSANHKDNLLENSQHNSAKDIKTQITSQSPQKKIKENIVIESKNRAYEILEKANKAQILQKNNKEKKALSLIHKNNKENEDYDFIYNILDKHPFLKTLNKQARDEIIKTMSLCKIKEGTKLFHQGDYSFYWYIVNDGEFYSYINGEFDRKFKRGDSFGEFDLLNESTRKYTIKAMVTCKVWTLKKEVFKKILLFIFHIHQEHNLRYLQNVHLPLTFDILNDMSNHLMKLSYQEGDIICRKGDIADCMYFIREGIIECKKNNKVIRELKYGENFGQRAIYKDFKRSLDVYAKTDVIIYSISYEFFKNEFGINRYLDMLKLLFIEMCFHNDNHFNNIGSKYLKDVFGLFKIKNYSSGETIFEKNTDISNYIVCILEGAILNKEENIIEAKRYEILFSKELIDKNVIKLKNNLIAFHETSIAIIEYDKMERALGNSLKNIQKQAKTTAYLDNIMLFKNLSEDKLQIIQSKLMVETFENGAKIITQGENGDKIYIIKSGRVDFFVNTKYVRSLNENEDFGARALLIQEKRSATAIANGPVSVYTLTAQVFNSILEPNLKDYLEKRMWLEDNTIQLKDLDNVKELGSGNFGFVNLVKSKKNLQLYAIKALNLVQIKKEKLQKSVELEKNVLLKVDHPFIMKMVKYLKNENFIFFIMEYIRGKELWEVIRDIGLLNKIQTQFYSGSMLLAIDYLHKKKVVYRDLKPENIMVNEMGYIKIIDFGTVKEIKGSTNTVIGTPHYMAPEILKGGGYSFEVDMWSIAVCMYEFFCGKLPFGEDCDDPVEVYKAVAKQKLEFPKFVKDKEFINLLTKMLIKDVKNRLYSFNDIKYDPYFKNFNWNKLISFAITPPYKVKFKKDNYKVLSTYMDYLNNQNFPKLIKKKNSLKQQEFDKWFKNF